MKKMGRYHIDPKKSCTVLTLLNGWRHFGENMVCKFPTVGKSDTLLVADYPCHRSTDQSDLMKLYWHSLINPRSLSLSFYLKHSLPLSLSHSFIFSLVLSYLGLSHLSNNTISSSISSRKQPIRTRYLGHVTVYQPIKDQYFLIRSVPDQFIVSTSVLKIDRSPNVSLLKTCPNITPRGYISHEGSRYVSDGSR
eukprot:sb/3470968/